MNIAFFCCIKNTFLTPCNCIFLGYNNFICKKNLSLELSQGPFTNIFGHYVLDVYPPPSPFKKDFHVNVEKNETDHMLMTTLGVQQQMKARTISTVILSVLALARLK